MSLNLDLSQLGKKSAYDTHYNPKLLFPIPRAIKRQEIGIDINNTGFFGVDIWTHYELSWLNLKGKPLVAIGEIIYPSSSVNIIESKSMKLYFNSFNSTKIANQEQLIDIVTNDIGNATKSDAVFKLIQIDNEEQTLI